MANKIIFGADLIDVLENKYNMNKLGEVPTKYKNGVTTIDFIYGKEKNIDDLKYNKPYVEFSIDDETDGFINGTMYLNGGVEGIQFDSWEDLKYFMKNAKWVESKKTKKSFIEKNTVNYWNKLHNIIPLDVKNESYRFATMCVTNLYNEDEYDSDDALIYFIDCYLSDKYPSWENEVDMNEVATMLYNGKLKWKDIDKSWFE